MRKNFLAGLTHTEFMRRHWQKDMLLARGALSQYAASVTRADLLGLAQREDIESRIVRHAGDRWRVQHGPFERRDLTRLPRLGWSLLVQGVDRVLEPVVRLLREFSFIPYARLDDVMVSYAAPGGSVGPHFDSYDVFLVQGQGKRRWRVGHQKDLTLVRDAPLRILERFTPRHEWTLESGDVLYLPPHWAHDGVALDECITYSIGFRAPLAQELGTHFLEFLQDRLALEGVYADPDLRSTKAPGRIPSGMISSMATLLGSVRWSRKDVVEFLGCYLSEPKPSVVYSRPARALHESTFADRARAQGVRLAPASRLLIYDEYVFMNGEQHRVGSRALRLFEKLANERELGGAAAIGREAGRLLYGWYRAGYIEVGAASRP
ncbi:MAG TPA: cupin domain-containing protein [Burkholderiales bacterium]|nr:cupin domain-containing protein [Burkholderiales bacterium]